MKAGWRNFILGVAAAATLAGPGFGQSGTSPEQVAGLRDRMRELQRAREATEKMREIVDWKQSGRPLPAQPGRGEAAVCLFSDMRRLRGAWTFRRAEATSATEALRVPIPLRGQQWISLPAGKWKAQLDFASPQTGVRSKLDPFDVEARSGGRYELALSDDSERRLDDLLAAKAKAAEHIAQKTAVPETPFPEPAKPAAPAGEDKPKGPSVSVEVDHF